MSELIHKKCNGLMKPLKESNSLVCSRCGFVLQKGDVFKKYSDGTVMIPVGGV